VREGDDEEVIVLADVAERRAAVARCRCARAIASALDVADALLAQ